MERQRKRERDRQRGRQRQRSTETDRERDRERERDRDRDRQTDRDRETYRERESQRERETERERQTNRQTELTMENPWIKITLKADNKREYPINCLLPDDKILALSKSKAFQQTTLSMCLKWCKLFFRSESIVEKGEMLVTSIFFYSHMFSKGVFSRVAEIQHFAVNDETN